MTKKERQAIRDRLFSYREHPVEFSNDLFNVNLDDWQKNSMLNVLHNQKSAIAGSTGCGKDFIAAVIIWWFFLTRPYCKIVCTAVKEDTLRDNLFAELSKMMRMSPLIEQFVNFGALKISAKGAEREWFIVARTASKRYSAGGGAAQAEGIAGKYSDDVLNIVDEASGVDDVVFDALEGSCNKPGRKMLILGNPLRRTGRFAQVFLDHRYVEDWARINVSYLDSSQTNGPDERRIREKQIEQYGEKSAFVQARIFGRFPTADSDDTIITREEINIARKRNVSDDKTQPIQIGIDLARFGQDESVWYVRRGLKSLEMVFRARTTIPEVVAIAEELAKKWTPQGVDPKHNTKFVIDEVGLGAGPVDVLRDNGWEVCGVHNGSRAIADEEYNNMAAQLWMEDAKEAVQVCDIIDDEILAQQLEARQYQFTGKGKQRRLTTKDELRRRGVESPDRAEAFVFAFAKDEHIGFASSNVLDTISFI